MPTDGVWTYAVIAAQSADARIDGLIGVAGEAVRAITVGDLAAVVGNVPLEHFGEQALRRNLEDLDWLEATARAHDSVISAVARSGPVVPVRMTTVYLSDRSAADLLVTRRDQFAAALEAVTARQELGVKAYADPKALVAETDTPASGPASGTAYLLRRKRALASQEEAFRLASAAARRIHETLAPHAVDAKRKPVSDQSLSGRAGWVVLNGTYLVDDSRVTEFRSAVAELDGELSGVDLEITGPWPPYSFAADVAGQ